MPGQTAVARFAVMMLKSQSQYRHYGRDLFWVLAPFDFCLSILNEWIESSVDVKFKAALSLLSEIESDFIFSKPEYVKFVLTKAQQHNFERLQEAKSTLFFCATRHGESRDVGQPGPTTLATKDRAAELANKYSADSTMADFYQSIVKRSEAKLVREKLEDEELIEGE